MPLTVACRANAIQKHTTDVSTLLFYKGKLYSGCDYGKIKIWSPDLVKQTEIQAHEAPVYSLAASGDNLYSSSSEGSVKIFDINTLKEKGALKEKENAEYWRVRCYKGCQYIGDNEGNIIIYKDNKFYDMINVAGPIKDLEVIEPYVMAAQDSDLVITELKLDGKKIRWTTDSTIPGRPPLTLIGKNLFALIDRDGKEMLLHSTDKRTGFKRLAKIVHGSEDDRVINAMASAEWGEQQFLFSGGWDKVLKRWRVINNQGLADEDSINVDFVINAIAAGDRNQVFAGGADGHIVRVDCR